MSSAGGKSGSTRWPESRLDGVVNITSWLQNPGTVLPNTPSGLWPNSVLVGIGSVGPFTASSIMNSAVWIGRIEFGAFSPGDNQASVSVGYNFVVDKGCVALGKAEAGDNIGQSNGSIAIGAGRRCPGR